MSSSKSSQGSLEGRKLTEVHKATLRHKAAQDPNPPSVPTAKALASQPRPSKPFPLRNIKPRRKSMKPVYIWGPAVALGVIGCTIYFSVSFNSAGSKVKVSTADGSGTGYIPVRMDSQIPPEPAVEHRAATANGRPLVYGFKIVREYAHDPNAFTQGLVYAGRNKKGEDILFESTGIEGASSVRRVELGTGKVLLKTNNRNDVFGEGLAFVDGGKKLMQIMWKTSAANLFDASTLKPAGTAIHGMTDGWGLTGVGNGDLYGSDGTEFLYLLDGKTFKTKRKVNVTDGNKAIIYLNELEQINGKVFANVWQTPCIARINPATGVVEAWIVMDTLVARARRENFRADVLNGIAWDAAGKRLFVTGKWWPKLYEVTLELQTARNRTRQLNTVRRKCWPSGGFL